jgi:hypothetical protein
VNELRVAGIGTHTFSVPQCLAVSRKTFSQNCWSKGSPQKSKQIQSPARLLIVWATSPTDSRASASARPCTLWRASSNASALPIPEEAPVITTTVSSILI